jgi:hypothetical protein
LPFYDHMFCENWGVTLHCIVVTVRRDTVTTRIWNDLWIEIKEFWIIFLQVLEKFRVLRCELRKFKKVIFALVWR